MTTSSGSVATDRGVPSVRASHAEPSIRREAILKKPNAATDVGGLADSPSKVSQGSGARLRQSYSGFGGWPGFG